MKRSSKKHLFPIIAISLLIMLSFSAVPVSAFTPPPSPHVGDIVVPAGDTWELGPSATYVLDGNLIVYGTLRIFDGSLLRMLQTASWKHIIDVREGGQLIVEDSTIESQDGLGTHWSFRLYCRFESSLTMVNSLIDDAYYIYVEYASSIDATGTSLERYLYVYYRSQAILADIEVYYVRVDYRSQATIKDGSFIDDDLRVEGRSSAVVEDSHIDDDLRVYEWSTVSVTEGSTVADNFSVSDNSTAIIADSEFDDLYAYYGSTVYVENCIVTGYIEADEGSFMVADLLNAPPAGAGNTFSVYSEYGGKLYVSNAYGIDYVDVYSGSQAVLTDVTMETNTYVYVEYGSSLLINGSSGGYYFGADDGSTLTLIDVETYFPSEQPDLYVGDGSQATVINSGPFYYVDVYDGSSALLKGSPTAPIHVDSYFYVESGSTVTLEHVDIVDYLDVYEGSTAFLSDVYVDDLYVEYGSNASLSDVYINDYFDLYSGSNAVLQNVTVKDTFYVEDGSNAYVKDSTLGIAGSYFDVYYGSILIVENSTFDFEEGWIEDGSIAKFYDSDITIDPWYLELYSGAIAEFYDCDISATDDIWVYSASVLALVDSTYDGDIWLEDYSWAIIEDTDISGPLFVNDLPNITVTDSTVVIQYATYGLNSIHWLHAYNAIIDVTDIEIYHLHNHMSTSTINLLGTSSFREERYGITAIVENDYGEPIRDAQVEIYNSLDELIFSEYTDSNGKAPEIFPELGTYTIKAYADSKEDSATVTLTDICIEETFTLDITKPMIGQVTQNPTTPDYTEDVTVTAEVSDPSGISSVTLIHNGNSITMTLVSGDAYTGTYSATIPTQPYGTTISYHIEAEDNSGNSISSDEYTYPVIDDIPPEATDITTSPTQPVYYETTTISVTLTDENGIAEASLIYTIDTTEYLVELTSAGTNTYTATIPKQPYGTQITYHITATDGLDNQLTTTPTTYTVSDDIPPTGQIITPSTGDHLRATVTVSITGYDTYFDKAELQVDDTPIKTWTESSIQTHPLNTTELTDGTHTIKLIIHDQAGNTAEENITITVDNTTPSVSITSPEEATQLTGNVTITFTASDDNLNKALLYIDNAEFDVTGQTSHEWDSTTVGDGSHTIRIVSTDKAGNSQETQISVTTTNVAGAYASGMNLGLLAGAVVFVFIGIAITFAIIKKPWKRS